MSIERRPRAAMVLAAGYGTRLRPITERMPKALVEVGGRPMIAYALEQLAAAGVTRVVVNLHHHGEALRHRLGDGREFGVEIAYSPEDPILETGGGIARARPLLGDGPFFVVNCDAFCDADLDALGRRHAASGVLATLLLREDPEAARYGLVEVDEEDRIARFLGRSAPGAESRGLSPRMFCGVHVISPAIDAWFPSSPAFSITRDVYAPAVAGGAHLEGITHAGYWRDLGTHEALAAAERDLASGVFVPRARAC